MGVVVVVVLSVLAVLALVPGSLDATEEANYLVGRGIADATGPVAEINMVSILKQKYRHVDEIIATGHTYSCHFYDVGCS